jgi:hypothetical protein
MYRPDPSFVGFPSRLSIYIAQGILFFQAFIYEIFIFFFKERGKPAKVNGSFAFTGGRGSGNTLERQGFPFGYPFREKKTGWREESSLKELR